MNGPRFVIAFTLALMSAMAGAQQLPPSGSAGLIIFAESNASGVNDQITILNTACPQSAWVPGGPPNANCRISFQLQNFVNRSLNRRALQSPTETAIAQAFDSNGAGPVLFAPTYRDDGRPLNFLEYVDLRPGAATQQGSVSLGSGTVPYDLLSVAGTLHAAVASPRFGGRVVIFSFAVNPGAPPTLAAVTETGQPPTPYATRMLIDPASGNLVVPLLNGVEVYNPAVAPPSLIVFPLIASFNTSNDSRGEPYIVGTNLNPNYLGSGGTTVICGLRAASKAAGHSFMAFGTAPGDPVSHGGIDPGGPGLALAPGFHEIAVAASPNGSVAAFLLDSLPVGSGSGAILLEVGAPAPARAIVPVAESPFGNPQPLPNGVVTFMSASPAGAFLGAAGTGGASLLGSYSRSNPMPGMINPTTCDRPVNLPGGNAVMVSNSMGGASGSLIYTVAINAGSPSVRSSGFFPAPGGAATLPTVLTAGTLGLGPIPIAAQGYADQGLTTLNDAQVIIGPPLAATPQALFFDQPTALPAISSGGLVLTPGSASPVLPFGPRRPGFNFIGGAAVSPVVVLPIDDSGFQTRLEIANLLAPPGSPSSFYLALGPIKTELLMR